MNSDSRPLSATETDEHAPAHIPTPDCDEGRHVVVLDEHGAGRCACGMVTRYPSEAHRRLAEADTVAQAEEA